MLALSVVGSEPLGDHAQIEEAIKHKATQLFQWLGASHTEVATSVTRPQLADDLAAEEQPRASSSGGYFTRSGAYTLSYAPLS